MFQTGTYTLGFEASNPIPDTETATRTITMVERLTGLHITDYGVVTGPNDEKCFDIFFDTLGTDTCIVMDFKYGKMISDDATFYITEAAFSDEYDMGYN